MPRIRRSVSSLASLAAFEAAARHGSFTLAAGELGVTQAAISRQVKSLETDLNAPLFVRSHRRVALTGEGQRLAQVMIEAFGRVAETVESIRRPGPDDTVIVGTTLAFAHFWLVPRLPAFRAAHPGIRLRLISEDTGFDLRQGRLDVVVRYGAPPFSDAVSLASMPDEVFAVCSPALLATIDPPAALGTMAAFPLIGLEWQDPAWLAWPRWAAMAGLGQLSIRSELRFNHYTDAIYAAMNGAGIVLGWRRLIAGLLADRRLVRFGAAVAIPAERYHVLRPNQRKPTRAAEQFGTWLMREIEAVA
jgi:DNA-binding transcriptional LysR family regulator